MKILNFGSLNIDVVYSVSHIVHPGETITSSEMNTYPGGKGLNQSIALAKAGVEVFHAGLIGNDGKILKDTLEENQVDTSLINTVSTPTGNAIIQVDKNGQNSIVLFPGANREISKSYVDDVMEHFSEGDWLLVQNEINEIPYILECAHNKKMYVAMNPSPCDHFLDDCNLDYVDLFLVNEVEARQLTGEDNMELMLDSMSKKYPKAEIVLTLGSSGSKYSGKGKVFSQDIYKAKVVDTTAAGDTFTGYFIAQMMRGQGAAKALDIGSMAASISVSRKGAAVSIPTMEEVMSRYTQIKQ